MSDKDETEKVEGDGGKDKESSQTLSSKTGGTPGETPKAEVEEKIKKQLKRLSDTNANLGRQVISLTAEKAQAEEKATRVAKQAEAVQSRLDALEEDRIKARYSKAKDDPDMLEVVKEEERLRGEARRLQKLADDLEAKNADITAREALLSKTATESLIDRLVTKYEVDKTVLVNLKTDDAEVIEGVAKALSKVKKGKVDKESGDNEEDDIDLDSNQHKGGDGSITGEEDMNTYAAKRKKQDPTLIR